MSESVTSEAGAAMPEGRSGAPAWAHGIVAMAGYWEPLSFRRRQGASSTDDESAYAIAHSEEMAKRLAEVGINSVVWHGYKGLGFEFEREEMEHTRRFGEHCRAHGIHLGTYCNIGSFFAETFFQHTPQARDWLTRDQHGLPHQYSEYYRVYYRYRPCLTHQAFADYVARMAAYLVEHVGSEWVLFDNNAMMPCYCDSCRREFRAFLDRRYPTDTAEGRARATRRFGYASTQHLELPRGTARMPIDTLPACHEPVLQEWVAYRCELLTRTFDRVCQGIAKTGKRVTISLNPPMDQGEFVPLVWGNEVEDLAPNSDYLFSEDGNSPRMDGSRLIGHFPTYKSGRAMNRRILVHQFNAPNISRALLEAAVHNRGCLGHVGWAEHLPGANSDLSRTLHFIHEHAGWYVNTRTLAEVAVLRGRHALVNNWAEAFQSLLSTQQCLYRYSVQYDLVLESQLNDLARYRVLVLPNTISLPDAALEAIRRYVKAGGSVLSLEQSGECDHWGRSRGVGSIGQHGERDSNLGSVGSDDKRRSILCSLLQLSSADAGRVVHLPRLEIPDRFRWQPDRTWMPSIGPQYWLMPNNARDVMDQLRGLLGGRQLVQLRDGPSSVAVQLLQCRSGLMLHAINYADEPSAPLQIQLGLAVRRASGHLLQSPEIFDVPVRECEGGAVIDVPSVDTYAAFHLELRGGSRSSSL